MTESQPQKELRLKSGAKIKECWYRFSASEKALFGSLAAVMIITALAMSETVNRHFMKEVPADGGVLREGLTGLPHAVNPVLAVTDADKDISALVYAGLTRYQNGKTVPDLASGWTVSPDGLTYDFTLRPGLAFQDGSTLSADDIVFTVSKIQDPALKSPLYADWANVTVSAPAPNKVEFVLKQPFAAFPAVASVGILPKRLWDQVTDGQFAFNQYDSVPVGAGPYKVVSVERDGNGVPTAYDLEAWGGYWKGKPMLSAVDFSFFQDADKAAAALESGSIDSMPSVPPGIAARLAKEAGAPFRLITDPMPLVFGVFLNGNKNAALADPAVRRALDAAVDRRAIVNGVLYSYGQATDVPTPPGLGVDSAAPAGPDPAGAASILAKDGWTKGPGGVYAKPGGGTGGKSASRTLSFTVYTADVPDLKQAADMLKSQWSALGASVDVKTFDPGDLYQSVIRPRDYDALLFGEAVGKSGDLYPFWHSSQRNAPGLNVAGYVSSQADKILEDIRRTGSPADRASDYASFDSIVRSDAPAVFLYSPSFIYAVPDSLRGLDRETIDSPSDRFGSVSDWYMNTDEVWDFFK